MKLSFSAYPFGSPMPSRSFSASSYRYGFNGKEKDDETSGAGNEYDFGDRIYDSRLGRWLGVDKYFNDYAPMSPYSFALNNPIVLVDGDGNKVIGTDGNEVTYTQDKNGTVKWSANATEDVKRVGNALLKTPTGAEQFKKAQAVSHDVYIVIDKTTIKKSKTSGNTLLGETTNDFNDKNEIIKSTITIYEVALVDQLLSDKDKVGEQGKKYQEVTMDQGIAADAGHEIDHATDPKNINDQLKNRDKNETNDLESTPEKTENKILDESIKQNKESEKK